MLGIGSLDIGCDKLRGARSALDPLSRSTVVVVSLDGAIGQALSGGIDALYPLSAPSVNKTGNLHLVQVRGVVADRKAFNLDDVMFVGMFGEIPVPSVDDHGHDPRPLLHGPGHLDGRAHVGAR